MWGEQLTFFLYISYHCDDIVILLSSVVYLHAVRISDWWSNFQMRLPTALKWKIKENYSVNSAFYKLCCPLWHIYLYILPDKQKTMLLRLPMGTPLEVSDEGERLLWKMETKQDFRARFCHLLLHNILCSMTLFDRNCTGLMSQLVLTTSDCSSTIASKWCNAFPDAA